MEEFFILLLNPPPPFKNQDKYIQDYLSSQGFNTKLHSDLLQVEFSKLHKIRDLVQNGKILDAIALAAESEKTNLYQPQFHKVLFKLYLHHVIETKR